MTIVREARRFLSVPSRPAPGLPAIASRRSGAVEYPELGMEAIWKSTWRAFGFIVDDKGNDFFREFRK